MKKLALLFALATLFTMRIPAFAQSDSSGSILVPGISRYFSNTYLYNMSQIDISNITNETITCKVDFYDNDGNERGNECTVYNGSQSTAGNQIELNNTKEFTIPPHCTRMIQFHKKETENISGYATIRWESPNAQITRALIGVHTN